MPKTTMLKRKHTKNQVCFFLFLSFFFTTISYGQNLQWLKSIGALNEDIGYGLKLDRDGNIICVGNFWGTVDFDPSAASNTLLSASSNRDIFVSKYDPSGSLIWAKKMGGFGPDHPHAVTVDTTGNIYTTGFFNSTCDFDPGAGTYTLAPLGMNGDVFISKLDNDGNFIWARKIGGTTNDFSFSISTDDNQNVFITGTYSGTWDFDPGAATYNLTAAGGTDIYILKLDVNGNFVWAKSIGGVGSDTGQALKVDMQGNVHVTGHFSVFGGLYNAFMGKYDTNGDLLWEKFIEGTNSSFGGFITVDNLGNVYSTGNFDGVSDFNPDLSQTNNVTSNGYHSLYVLKLDIDGNFVWVKQMGTNSVIPTSITLDKYNNVYSSGYFYNNADMDPGPGVHNLVSTAASSGYISILDTHGSFIGAGSVGGGYGFARIYSVDVDNTGKVFSTGLFEDTLMFASSSQPDLISNGDYDIFLAGFSQKGVSGYIYNDINQNCIKENNEPGLKLRRGMISPGNIVVETDNNGRWNLDSLQAGNYNLTFDVPVNWLGTCSNTINFSVINPNSYIVTPSFGLVSTNPCSQPDVSIIAPVLRRCFSEQKIYVNACNLPAATGALINAYIDVKLDSLIRVDSASIAYTSLGNSHYRFNVNSINPDQCVKFTINTTVNCAAVNGITLCMEAKLFPVDSCVLDITPSPSLPLGTTAICTGPWDRSSLSVAGYCENDSVYFTVTNNGSAVNGNMQCASPVRIYVDGVLTYINSATLAGGQAITYSYPGNGQTWVVQADQHPMHPGNSHPTDHVEACGDTINWIPNQVNDLPLNDADPIADTYCGVVSGSYDPNDKTGYPQGLGTQNDILPNQQLQYLIRFQNTGSDTAFTVIIRDTLDMDLDIFSVVSGASSHNYTFKMYGPRILEWTFSSIMLPDSNANEILSHGFVTFKVDQKSNLPNGTTILNDADIYFDFNSPVITNQTLHTINDQLNYLPVVTIVSDNSKSSSFKVYPNPASNNVTIVSAKENVGSAYRIMNQLGQTLVSGKLGYEINTVELSNLASGFYLILIESKDTKYSLKLIKQ